MKIIGFNDWTLGFSCKEHVQENKEELLKATLVVMQSFGPSLKTIEWFGNADSNNQIKKAA